MVEMAIVLPLLMLLLFGMMEYGWVFLRVSQINMAARNGVRTAVRPGATDTQVTTAVSTVMTDAGMQNSNYTLTHSDLNVGVGNAVSVHISVDYSKLTLTGTKLIPLPTTLHAWGTMAKEGPPTGS